MHSTAVLPIRSFILDCWLHFLPGTSSKPMAVPGSSPFVVIDADGDSGFTVSVESKFAVCASAWHDCWIL